VAGEQECALALRVREQQLKELAQSGAGSQFDYEQGESNVANLEGHPAEVLECFPRNRPVFPW
jgi:hypothetical protein